MPLVDLTSTPLPNDDENADAIDIAGPINAILAVLNGHIDADNIEPGSMPWSIMDSFTNEIPAAAMENEGNVKLYRQESNLAWVPDGLVWSISSGLNGAMTSGVLYARDGSRVEVNAVASRTFTASKDTWVTVGPNGTIDYAEVSNGASPPTLGTDYTPVALVVTNGSAITAIHATAPRRPDEIARMTLGAASDIMSIANIPARKFLRIVVLGIPTGGNIRTTMRFNNDSSANYARRRSDNGGADATGESGSEIYLSTNNIGQITFATADIINIATQAKLVKAEEVDMGSSGAANAPNRSEVVGKWHNTSDLINRIDIINTANSSAGDYAAGSQVIVYGWD